MALRPFSMDGGESFAQERTKFCKVGLRPISDIFCVGLYRPAVATKAYEILPK